MSSNTSGFIFSIMVVVLTNEREIIMESLQGTTIRGYEIHEEIGAGGFGTVYRALQASIGREVAIKVILPQFASQPNFIRRFDAEAQLVVRME